MSREGRAKMPRLVPGPSGNALKTRRPEVPFVSQRRTRHDGGGREPGFPKMIKRAVKSLLETLGLEVRRVGVPALYKGTPIPDVELYRPRFSPWLGQGEFRRYCEIAAPRTLVSPDRLYVLQTLLLQAVHVPGDVWECGVYRGGTAAMMAAMLAEHAPGRQLHLFDTFAGMPATDARVDWHQEGDFADTSAEAVKEFVGHPGLCVLHPGFIPATFAGLEEAKVCFAHIDVDIHQSILDSLDFIWPRLSTGGMVVFDDYGFPSCPGARAAVDSFFARRACRPLCLATGQAVVFKSLAEA